MRESLYQPKGLHFIIFLRIHIIDVQDTGVSTFIQTTVLLYRLKNLPTYLPIPGVTRQTISKEN